MYSEHARTALMYVDYGGDAYAGMGIKAMKSFARPRGMERCERSPVVSLLIFSSSLFFYTRYSVRCFRKIFSLIRSTSAVFNFPSHIIRCLLSILDRNFSNGFSMGLLVRLLASVRREVT